MEKSNLEAVLAGSNDERLLAALYFGTRVPGNDAQRTFHLVWEASELLASDGFEMLLEQSASLEEYAAAFDRIGLPAVKAIFDKVACSIPPTLRMPGNEDALFEHVGRSFDDLKALLYEYYDNTRDLASVVANFVRRNADAFNGD